jgi:hypothetical protein
MPTLNIDQFDEPPKIGDQVTVTGKVNSIDQNSGDVDVSYDSVSLGGQNNQSPDNEQTETENPDEPENLDSALSKAFPNTQ